MWQISIKVRLTGVSPTSPATCSPVPSPRSVLWPRLWAWASASHLCVAGGPWWSLWGQQILSRSWFSSALQSGVAFSSRQKHWLGSTCFQSAHKWTSSALLLPRACQTPRRAAGAWPQSPCAPSSTSVSTPGGLLTADAPQSNPQPRASFLEILLGGEGIVSDSPSPALCRFGVWTTVGKN